MPPLHRRATNQWHSAARGHPALQSVGTEHHEMHSGGIIELVVQNSCSVKVVTANSNNLLLLIQNGLLSLNLWVSI